ncbi:MAG: alpha/beta hydrolase [Cyanobacteria bacterium J06597_16]
MIGSMNFVSTSLTRFFTQLHGPFQRKRSYRAANIVLEKTALEVAFKTVLRVAVGVGVFPVAIALSPQLSKPTQAAERISVSFGPIERSISVESLEIYVEEGRITDEIEPYIDFIDNYDPEALAQVQALLSQRADVDVTTMAQFAYTPQGEYLLEQAGEVFRTGARLPGGKGLRGAAIGAAADSEKGLTILNVIQRFPTPVLRVDLRRGLAIASQVSETLSQSQKAIDLVVQLSFDSATLPFPEGTTAASINELVSRPGPYNYRKLPLRVKASNQPVDVYLPLQVQVGLPASTPAVIISHGFGNDRGTYAYLASFLAQQGFAVINVEHPGSSADQLDALVSGRTGQVVPDDEFINRPLLISAVLDDLQALAATSKSLSTVDFENVGIIGQSFGGYTALTVAGAPVDLAALRETCPPEFSVNLSLLLQCQAVALSPANEPQGDAAEIETMPPASESIVFTDPRIKAAIAINPIASTILGPKSLAQIEVPVLMMTGSADTVAPALPEQILPYTWLHQGLDTEGADSTASSDRYLLTMEGGTHFSTMGLSGRETFELPPEIIGPVPEVAQRYTQVMSLAFLSTYLNNDSRYQPVLTSAFVTRISEPDMPLSIISELSPEQLQTRLSSAAQGTQATEYRVERHLQQLVNDIEITQNTPFEESLLEAESSGNSPEDPDNPTEQRQPDPKGW